MTETDKKKLLEVRKTIKDRKPEFKQQNFGRKKKISDRWRRPKGIQSKMRHKFKGYSIMVSKGWRSPVEVRGLDRKGYDTVVVFNVSDVEKLEKGKAIIISANVGNKKRLAIVEKAEALKIPIVNIKADKFKEKIAKQKSDKEKEKAEKSEKKKKTIEDSLKKAEKKEKDKKEHKHKKDSDSEGSEGSDADVAAEEAEADEQKAEEKKVKDDVLIHKD
jgi:large subunit ribosomal protein L32e